MEPKNAQEESLNVLMASGVPKRREGGVAAIIYNFFASTGTLYCGQSKEFLDREFACSHRISLRNAAQIAPLRALPALRHDPSWA